MKHPPRPPVSAPYRIHTVAELTGVAAPTLRAWERRYGVPAPDRTASAYRLYGPAAIAEIERMRDLCAQGVSAAQAAATVTRERGAQGEGIAGGGASRPRSVERLVQAAARLDGGAIDRELALATELDDVIGAFEGVVKPAMEQIGELWASGALSVGHEHFASERIGSFLLAGLRTAHVADAGPRSVLLACFDEEQHELPLLGVAVRFAQWGFRPLLLGARTPPAAVGATIATARPSLVALSVTIAPEPRRARTLADAYGREIGETPWIVGGAAVEKIAPAIRRAGGIVVLEPLSLLHRSLRLAIKRSPPTPPWGDRR